MFSRLGILNAFVLKILSSRNMPTKQVQGLSSNPVPPKKNFQLTVDLMGSNPIIN
jgi:hypothetical protein